jgi:hypothetical protein
MSLFVSSLRLFGGLGLLLTFGVGCSAATDDADIDARHHPRKEAGQAKANVIVLQRTPGVDLQVEPDRLKVSLDDDDDLRVAGPGDIVVCPNGGGFLRRVLEVREEDGNLVVLTERAPLTAAIESGGLQHALSLPMAKDFDVSGPEGEGVAVGLGNTTLVSDGSVDVSIREGHFHFDPGFDLALDISGGHLEYFEAVAKGTIDAGLTVDVTLHDLSVKALYDKELWSHEYPFFQMIGPVPVVGAVELSVGVGVEVDGSGNGTLTTGGSVSASMAAGARYDGEWHAVGDHDVWMTPITTTYDGEGEFSVGAFAYAEVAIKFYDIVGPAISVGPYVALTKTYGDPAIVPGVGLFGLFEAQVDVPFLEDAWVGYSASLFDVSREFPPEETETTSETGETGSDACGGVSYEGLCSAGSVYWCSAGVLWTADCAAAGYGCDFIDDSTGYYCTEGCGDLDYVGGCNGESLRWCEDGKIVTYDCGSIELGCGFDGELYNCL